MVGPAADHCYWAATAQAPELLPANLDQFYDLVVIGAGYTGVNAALAAAQAGLNVLVLDAHAPGWGASGRNGGFCCLGGDHLGPAAIAARHGRAQARQYAAAQKAAISRVATLCQQLAIDADICGHGEWLLAHTAKRQTVLEDYQQALADGYGLAAQLQTTATLDRQGNRNPAGHGALWNPAGFGLHPLKYLYGLVAAAQTLGVRFHSHCPATALNRDSLGWRVQGPSVTLASRYLLIATNGYTPDALSPALSGCILPAQSNILVTRPLSDAELVAQHWQHHTPAYDTRQLLYYFRLLPDRRFLFGGRAGISESATSFAARRRQHTADFRRYFPAWSTVDIDYFWRGRVALSKAQTPHVCQLQPGLFCALAYHGNGVAMGSWCGRQAVQLLLDADHELPAFMQQAPARFPLPALRPLYLAAAYAAYKWLD